MEKQLLWVGILTFAVGCGGGGGGGGGTTPAPTVTAPTAPSVVATTVLSATSIRVTWVDNSSNEDGFTVEYLISPATTFQTAGTVAANVTQFTHPNLTASTNYTYRVKATNTGGSTISTNQATGTTSAAPVTAPAAPSTLTAQAMSSTQINLAWTDNASNEDGFKIERKTGSSGTYAQIDTVGANVVAYSSTGLTASTQYYFRIRAYNTAGDSSYSNTVNATTQAASGGSGTWVEQTLPTAFQTYNFSSIAGSSANDLFAVGSNPFSQQGFILHKDATGWTEQTIPIAVNSVYLLTVFSANNVYAQAIVLNGTTRNGRILHWDGTTWVVVFQQNNWAANYTLTLSASNIYVVGSNGTIVHWDGVSWTAQTSGTTTDLWSVWASSATDVFVVGGVTSPSTNPIILHSTNGTTWSSQVLPTGVTTRLTGIADTSGSNVVAVGDGGAILRYNGVNWVKEASGTTDTIVGPWVVSGNTFVVSVYHLSPMQGELLQSSGSNWTSKATVNDALFFGVDIVSGTNAFAIGGNSNTVNPSGVIYRYDGTSWALESQPRATVLSIWTVSTTDIWAAGTNGLILRRQ